MPTLLRFVPLQATLIFFRSCRMRSVVFGPPTDIQRYAWSLSHDVFSSLPLVNLSLSHMNASEVI